MMRLAQASAWRFAAGVVAGYLRIPIQDADSGWAKVVRSINDALWRIVEQALDFASYMPIGMAGGQDR